MPFAKKQPTFANKPTLARGRVVRGATKAAAAAAAAAARVAVGEGEGEGVWRRHGGGGDGGVRVRHGGSTRWWRQS